MFIIDAWKWLVDTTASWSTLGILIRLLLALSVGLVIGIDRERKRRVAGIKTHILVCLGAALVMITSQYMSVNFENGGDPARLGAQVISGVGFLGAGTIMKSKASIKGITTAASIWAVACVGLACGAGFYVGALVATIFIIGTTYIANAMEKRMHRGECEPEVEPYKDYYEIVDEE
jgi:putative Mg2+ transporter-C (MgtC) family protein